MIVGYSFFILYLNCYATYVTTLRIVHHIISAYFIVSLCSLSIFVKGKGKLGKISKERYRSVVSQVSPLYLYFLAVHASLSLFTLSISVSITWNYMEIRNT